MSRKSRVYNYIVNTFDISKENIMDIVKERVEDIVRKHIINIMQSNDMELIICDQVSNIVKDGMSDHHMYRKTAFEEVVKRCIKNVVVEELKNNHTVDIHINAK